jgi:ketosteroid isomerase-like protein
MIKIVYKIFYGLCLLQLFNGCSDKKNPDPAVAKQEILETDRSFSEFSRKHGMKKAFIEFIDNDGVLLRPNHLPIIGAYAIDFLTQVNDSSYTLTWRPSSAMVSASADLGYTYGIYDLQLPDTNLSGTYVSIWKKQQDGKWKFVLDTGNEGVELNKK